MKVKLLFMLLFAGFVSSVNAGDLNGAFAPGEGSGNPVVLGQNYPNPAKSKTDITFEFSTGQGVIRIYTVLGKLVEEIIVSSEKKMITLDVSDYQEGIYLYTIEADGQKITHRMTVRK